MWLLLIVSFAFAQWNDAASIRDQTIDILKGCGFTKSEFDHLKSIYEADIPELNQRISRTKALRDEKMEELWQGTKERVKDMEGASINEILDKELAKIKEFLNHVSADDGLPVKGVGKTLQYDLIGQDERRNILVNIRKAYPEGAKSAKDFKIMFNVMRAFLVIKGTEHIDEHIDATSRGAPSPLKDGEKQEQQPPDTEPLIEDKKKEKKKKPQHTIGKKSEKPGETTKMMEDHGMEHPGDGYETPKYAKKEEEERREPYSDMEKDRGHRENIGYHEPRGKPNDQEDDAEPGSEDYPSPEHSAPENDTHPEDKGNDARDGREPVDSDKKPPPPLPTQQTPPQHAPPTPPSFLQSGPPSVQGNQNGVPPSEPVHPANVESGPTAPSRTPDGYNRLTLPAPSSPATPGEPAPIVSGPATPSLPNANIQGPATPVSPTTPQAPATAPVVPDPGTPSAPTTPITPNANLPTGPQNAAVPPVTGPTDGKPPHTRTETKSSSLVASLTDILTTNRLRWIIYIFLGFVVALGFYLLSPSRDSTKDYMPLFDDEV